MTSWEELPSALAGNRAVALAVIKAGAVEDHPIAEPLHYASADVQGDFELVKAAIETSPYAFISASEQIRDNMV